MNRNFRKNESEDAIERDGGTTTLNEAAAFANNNNEPSTGRATEQLVSIDDAIEKLGMGHFQRSILVAAGLCFAADSMEVLLLSFLSVILQAQWNLSPSQTSTITASVFCGAMLGTVILGPLGDKVGRRPVFIWTAAIITVFGFATAVANSFAALVAVRFLVGFGVGGLIVPFDTLAEFVPASHRGSHLMAVEYFWTAGTLLTPIFAYLSLGNSNSDENSWKLFVVLCAFPCLLSTVIGIWCVPESPRWLLTQGRHEEALMILRQAAVCNKKDPYSLYPVGTVLVKDEQEEESHNFLDLLKPRWRRTTLFLWTTWFGFAICYYGTIIAVTLVFSSTEEEEDVGNNEQDSAALFYSFDYSAIFVSASSEIAGTTLVLLFIDRIGRVPCQTYSYIAGGCMALALCVLAASPLHASQRPLLLAAAFGARMSFMAASCATWVATAEILTTEIRTTGHSASNAIARLGGSLSPFLVSKATPFPVIGSVLLLVSLVTGWAAWNLPETMGRHMGQHMGVVSGGAKNCTKSTGKDQKLEEAGYEML